MIRRTFLGLDLCGRQLQAVALRRRGTKAPALVDVRLAPFPEDCWSLSVREPNIRDRAAFIAAVKGVLDPIARGGGPHCPFPSRSPGADPAGRGGDRLQIPPGGD